MNEQRSNNTNRITITQDYDNSGYVDIPVSGTPPLSFKRVGGGWMTQEDVQGRFLNDFVDGFPRSIEGALEHMNNLYLLLQVVQRGNATP